MTARTAPATGVAISVEALAWVAATALFLGLRFAVTWQAPVGGEELSALSGAWQAAHDVDDGRFIPTLFQALSALSLISSESEVPARILAFLATASLPVVFYLLRPVLGVAGALLALLVAAIDGPAIYFGVAATTSALDLALLAWLFLLFARPDLRSRFHPSVMALPSFLVATAGALILPFVLAAALVYARSFDARRTQVLAWPLAGAAAGLVAASAGFGFGWQGLTIPPLLAFSRAFDNETTTLTALDAWTLYAWPIAAGGVAALVVTVLRTRGGRSIDDASWLLVAWSLIAALLAVAALSANSVASLPALTLPLTFVLGPALADAAAAVRRADWTIPRFVLPVALLLAVIAFAYAADWGRQGTVGDAADVARVVALVSAAAAALAVAGVERSSRPTLLVPAAAVGAVVLVVGAFGIGLSGDGEAVPSPVSPPSARALRALAIEARDESGGPIVLHPRFAEEVTWPFRDSGNLRVASSVPPDAAIVLWPPELPAPEGFVTLEGEWALLDDIRPPTGDALDLLRWYIDRNRLQISHHPLAVYIKSD